MDPKVLSYHHACLRKSDVRLLYGTNWLNDQVITFYFEYLRQERFKNLQGKLNEQEYIILPVNNNVDVTEAEGGSHWSLLIYSARARTFRHYDTAHGMNYQNAQKLAAALVTVLAINDPSITAALEGMSPEIHEAESPKQENSWDCGVYVLKIAEELGAHIGVAGDGDLDWEAVDAKIKSEVTADSVEAFRSSIPELIDDLASAQASR